MQAKIKIFNASSSCSANLLYLFIGAGDTIGGGGGADIVK